MKPPKSLFIGDAIACECYGGKPGEAPYVDVRIDTLPPTDDDTDYSEDPQVLINIAMC